MKKKMIALLAGALMMISASSAFAFVQANQEIYRVIYDASTATTFEAVSDLGSLSSLQGLAAGTAIGDSFTSISGYSTAVAAGADLRVGYFAFSFTGREEYVGFTGFGNTPNINPQTYSTTGSILRGSVIGSATGTGYTKAAGTTAMTGLLAGGTGNNSSFKSKMTDGTYASAFTIANGADYTTVSLANLASSTLTKLYKWTGTDAAGSILVGEAVLGLNTNKVTGFTSVASLPPTATPIPAAAYLLGSGLLGLVGIRRKKNKA